MAYTKIHAIKATVDKAIDYICNPEKTDEKMFVSSYACSPETAAYDFKYTLDHCRENSPNKAYHLILCGHRGGLLRAGRLPAPGLLRAGGPGRYRGPRGRSRLSPAVQGLCQGGQGAL